MIQSPATVAEDSGSLSFSEAQKVFEYVKDRSRTDSSFRQKLLNAPRETLEAELDISLPDSFSIRFVENLGADLTVVLPDPEEPSDELSDQDLDYVAGGARIASAGAFEEFGRQRSAHESEAWAARLSS